MLQIASSVFTLTLLNVMYVTLGYGLSNTVSVTQRWNKELKQIRRSLPAVDFNDANDVCVWAVMHTICMILHILGRRRIMCNAICVIALDYTL